ncbi:universal stress protein [Plantactinospora sp. WMMB334]|uniref:universal stress protein n=1 Tax=Plantactinospora sp. WMMB334 TaxID=3404119 RepID=UPI003B951EDB
MKTQPVVVGYDASESAQAALGWALDEGARAGVPVRLIFAFEWQAVAGSIAPVPGNWPDQGAREDARKMVDAAVSQARQTHPEVTVTGTVVDGAAAVVLRELSRKARLLVLGSRGHGGFADLLLGSTSITVTAHAHCPVVVVRGETPPPAGPVVVGVDGSDSALFALQYAGEQAVARGTELRVVRAWTAPAPRWRPADYEPAVQGAAEQAELDELLAGWQAVHPQVKVIVEVIEGPAGRVMVDASQDAQLVVVGSRGRGGFRGLLLGSISQQLLHHAHCPVAVVRELPTATA